MSAPRYAPQSLIDFANRSLVKAGLQADMAQCVALTLVEGDLLGHDTHGLNLLAPYVKEVQSGSMTATGSPKCCRTNRQPCGGMASVCRAPGW